MSNQIDTMDEVAAHDFREATAKDVVAIRRLFDANFPIRYDDRFYDFLEQGIEKGSLLGTEGKMVCAVAVHEGQIAGAIVLHTMNVSDAKATGKLTFDLVERQKPSTLAAYILLLAVRPKSRRQGVASDLIYHSSLMLGSKLTASEGDDLSAVSILLQSGIPWRKHLSDRPASLSCCVSLPRAYRRYFATHKPTTKQLAGSTGQQGLAVWVQCQATSPLRARRKTRSCGPSPSRARTW